MDALIFLVDTLFSLYLAVLLLRLLLQWTRADFRNPMARGILQVTSPLIVPLRRILPSAGPVDSASVVAILVLLAIKLLLLASLGAIHAPSLPALAQLFAIHLLRLVLNTYLFSLLLYAASSFVAPGSYSPARQLLANVCEPVLRPIRRHIPSINGLDLSPLWAMIAIQALLLLLR